MPVSPRDEGAADADRGLAPADPNMQSSGKRRSALTSAFEELALHTNERSPEGESFSAHVHVGESSINVKASTGLRGPAFGGSPFNQEDDFVGSAGRQHGSFNMMQFLAESDDAGAVERPVFSFSGEESDPDSPLTSFTWNASTALASAEANGAEARDGSRHRDGREMGRAIRIGSAHGVAGERGGYLHAHADSHHDHGFAAMPPRLVTVHVDDEEENVTSAGRKQRGSSASLLLMEAHELSMMDSSQEERGGGLEMPTRAVLA